MGEKKIKIHFVYSWEMDKDETVEELLIDLEEGEIIFDWCEDSVIIYDESGKELISKEY